MTEENNMKIFLFQGDSITDAVRIDDNEDNFGLGFGYLLNVFVFNGGVVLGCFLGAGGKRKNKK